jgi:hypothetical protein
VHYCSVVRCTSILTDLLHGTGLAKTVAEAELSGMRQVRLGVPQARVLGASAVAETPTRARIGGKARQRRLCAGGVVARIGEATVDQETRKRRRDGLSSCAYPPDLLLPQL